MDDRASAKTDICPFFLDSPRGPLFCLYLAPAIRLRGCVIYIHPFAEEMHKSRRMAAQMARAFAAAGHAVLQVDLTGCGDSAGDFGDASWEAWKSDIALACDWLRERSPNPITLWGLRVGAALAVDVSRELEMIDRLILWHPMVNGELFLNQFLRIKLAAEMLTDGQAQTGTKALRAQLENGESVEVGGYMLSPAMARALTAWKLADHIPPCPVYWYEIGAGEGLSPANQKVVQTWSAEGVTVFPQAMQGEPFWLTQEITECPALLEASLSGQAQ